MAIQFLYTFLILIVASAIIARAFIDPKKDYDSQGWTVNITAYIFFGSIAGVIISAIAAVWGF